MSRSAPTPLPVEIDFDPAPGVVILRYRGAVSAEGLSAAQNALIERVNGRTVTGLLLDVRDSTAAYSPGELLGAMEDGLPDFALERVAVVCGPDRERLVMLIQTAAFPHGVRVRAFEDSDEALRFAAGG